MKIAIVLKLEKKIEDKIINLKNIFKRQHKRCLFIDDFPHLTLLTANVNLKMIQLKKIDLKINFKDIKINISKPSVFKKDPLTGGETFFFRVNKNKKLLNLQLYLASFFKRFILHSKIINKFDPKTLEYKSLKNYGFPYVGKHWIPHVSICSVLDKKINKKINTKFLQSKLDNHFYINELFLCVVKKNKLFKIKKIKFIN